MRDTRGIKKHAKDLKRKKLRKEIKKFKTMIKEKTLLPSWIQLIYLSEKHQDSQPKALLKAMHIYGKRQSYDTQSAYQRAKKSRNQRAKTSNIDMRVQPETTSA